MHVAIALRTTASIFAFFNLNSMGEGGRAREQGAAGDALCVFVQRTVKIRSNENTEFLSFPCYLQNYIEVFNKAP